MTIDSSIWISALEYGGVPRQAIEHAMDEDQVLLCIDIENEVVHTMSRKFAHAPKNVQAWMAELSKGSVWVIVTGKLSGICRDPKDDFILECAETGDADIIVTGDKDLLSLGSYGTIKIVTARQYLDSVRQQ